MASPSAGAPALKYGDVNTETTSPGEIRGLIGDEDFRCILKDYKEYHSVEELKRVY